jgi:hypothetical protein
MSSTYVNGYVKDQPLRNLPEEEVLAQFTKFNSTFGRKALLHSSKKVVSANKSIQGPWRDNMWNNYPKHMLEHKRKIPYVEMPDVQLKEIKEKKIKYNFLTNYMRKKFFLPEYNKND